MTLRKYYHAALFCLSVLLFFVLYYPRKFLKFLQTRAFNSAMFHLGRLKTQNIVEAGYLPGAGTIISAHGELSKQLPGLKDLDFRNYGYGVPGNLELREKKPNHTIKPLHK